MAGRIAHDIDNVLQAISGAITLIERQSGDNAAISRYMRITTDALERGASVTRRLLTFSRRGDRHTETLDVATLIQGLQGIPTFTFGIGIDMRISLPDDLPPIIADKGQLETVIVNLATNARDAMPHGGRLLISVRPETVFANDPPHPTGLNVGQYIQTAITGIGMGMDALTLVRAHEPFFTTKKQMPAPGLGLPMAHGFAEQSGGALTIGSGLSEGATVTLWLPQAIAEPATSAAKSSWTAITGDPLRILVVDDEATIREILAQHLRHAGYTILLAADGTEALDLLHAGTIVDAVVTDWSMPGIDGIPVIQAVRNRLPRMPLSSLSPKRSPAASHCFASRSAMCSFSIASARCRQTSCWTSPGQIDLSRLIWTCRWQSRELAASNATWTSSYASPPSSACGKPGSSSAHTSLSVDLVGMPDEIAGQMKNVTGSRRRWLPVLPVKRQPPHDRQVYVSLVPVLQTRGLAIMSDGHRRLRDNSLVF